MGRDKALMEVRGQALAVTVAGALAGAGARRVHALGGDAEALTAAGLQCVNDRWPGRGPGVAVADALDRCAAGVLVVAACDHPGLGADTVSTLVASLGMSVGSDAPAAIAVAVSGGRRHPTLSAWRRQACAPVAARWMASGGSSLTSLIDAVAVGHTVVDVGINATAALDLDSPADVARYDSDVPRFEGHRLVKEFSMDIPQIDIASLAAQLDAGGRLIDVRQPDEYAEVHVPGAVLIPLADVPDRIEAFAGDGPVYVICRSGARSGRAVEFLRSHDVDAVNVIGGTVAWVESGAATVSGDQPG